MARSSSLISPPEAGPMAIVRRAMEKAGLRDAAAVARRKVEESIVAGGGGRGEEGRVK